MVSSTRRRFGPISSHLSLIKFLAVCLLIFTRRLVQTFLYADANLTQ